MDIEKKWDFVAIHKKYQREYFDCGYSALNDYLKKHANQNHDKGIAKTFIAVDKSQPVKVEGFYTVSASTIEFKSLPKPNQKGIPAYPIPSFLIGKLAVEDSIKEQGLRGELLVDAMLRAVKTAQEVGIFAVRVDAIDLKAKDFYLKYEFIPFQDKPLSLFLPVKTIIKFFSLEKFS